MTQKLKGLKTLDKDSDGKVTLDEYVSTRAKWGKEKMKVKNSSNTTIKIRMALLL